MSIKKAIAAATLAAMTLIAVPAVPALANGAASTRNIILGGALATYLVVEHNRKVHEKYAQDAAENAAANERAHDAWAAYSSAEHAYTEEAAVNAELKKEVAYQHKIVVQQRHELAQIDRNRTASAGTRSVATASNAARSAGGGTGAPRISMVSYGWGTI